MEDTRSRDIVRVSIDFGTRHLTFTCTRYCNLCGAKYLVTTWGGTTEAEPPPLCESCRVHTIWEHCIARIDACATNTTLQEHRPERTKREMNRDIYLGAGWGPRWQLTAAKVPRWLPPKSLPPSKQTTWRRGPWRRAQARLQKREKR